MINLFYYAVFSGDDPRECAALAFFNLSADRHHAAMTDCGAADALIELLNGRVSWYKENDGCNDIKYDGS